MKYYLFALIAVSILTVSSNSFASDLPTLRNELKLEKSDQVYIGSVTRADGIILLYGDGVSDEITYAEFVSQSHSYDLVNIENARTDYLIVRGRFTFTDENGNSKIVILNNASFD